MEPQKYQYLTNNVANVVNSNKMEPSSRSESDNYDIETYQVDDSIDDSRDYMIDSKPNYLDNSDHITSTNHIASNHDTSVMHSAYSDEWQPTEEKFSSNLRRIRESESSNIENSSV